MTYQSILDGATQLIRSKGQLLTFTRVVKGVYDAQTGRTSSDVSTSYAAYAVKDQYRFTEKSSANIKQGDIKLIAEVADFARNDTVVVGGDQYRIIDYVLTEPGDTAIIYELQVRK